MCSLTRNKFLSRTVAMGFASCVLGILYQLPQKSKMAQGLLWTSSGRHPLDNTLAWDPPLELNGAVSLLFLLRRSSMYDAQTRREFLRQALAFGTAVPLAASGLLRAEESPRKAKSPNEKLNLGVIGVAG